MVVRSAAPSAQHVVGVRLWNVPQRVIHVHVGIVVVVVAVHHGVHVWMVLLTRWWWNMRRGHVAIADIAVAMTAVSRAIVTSAD